MFKCRTSFWSYRDHLINLSSDEGYPDEIVLDNRPPFNSKGLPSSSPVKHQGHHIISPLSLIKSLQRVPGVIS